ncbi:MAG TPA: hypothetical protein VIX73_23670 [Kofleriaceae bacterium]|jgi:hypothetical protein
MRGLLVSPAEILTRAARVTGDVGPVVHVGSHMQLQWLTSLIIDRSER